ncbi:unnamed protein product [Vicia faba]|uniref:Uncharacterized protein n=1 Tax=Vicia faba TaxID=3906 RepID=A0AAV1B5G2_VICFA|nr:unnamed protein product [Vicia faba]CAI8617896.1 unnamed protein product [Vicia faba]
MNNKLHSPLLIHMDTHPWAPRRLSQLDLEKALSTSRTMVAPSEYDGLNQPSSSRRTFPVDSENPFVTFDDVWLLLNDARLIYSCRKVLAIAVSTTFVKHQTRNATYKIIGIERPPIG